MVFKPLIEIVRDFVRLVFENSNLITVLLQLSISRLPIEVLLFLIGLLVLKLLPTQSKVGIVGNAEKSTYQERTEPTEVFKLALCDENQFNIVHLSCDGWRKQ